MDLDEMKQLFKDSIDEAKTPIDLFKIILEKTYQKGVDDGKSEQGKLNDIIHNISWAKEYIEAVGEEHKQAYIDGLDYAMKLLREISNELSK